ncbi:hypothetical protein FRB97_000632 [Tulasnella sp. 331]|nr:hypothetical protein FRB97_000632 [Tulasnella sp. 331]
MRILASVQRGGAAAQGQRYLVEAPIMFESIRPFLETLTNVNPSSIPFARYLAHPENGTLEGVNLQLPTFASIPNYSMDLSGLFNQSTDLRLYPSDPGSVERARVMLKAESRLDPSQADAVLNTLVSDVSMIQGPPGTGKSFCGTEILQVLVANKVRPILLIAFTNHALDNILVQVLEKKITDKVVRLGSHSKHEVIVKYGLKELLKTSSQSGMGKAASAERWKLKDIQKDMETLMEKIVKRIVPIGDMGSHLTKQYPNHANELDKPPFWVDKLFEDSLEWENADGRPVAATLLQFWLEGGDLAFITPPAPPSEEPSLSMDNKRTGQIYRFDQSLMERLSEMGLRMSRLDVQRRMRPAISHLIRQGTYSQSGDIVVLCAYLGQLQKIRLALAKEVTTVIDDRDAAQLVDHEEQENQATVADTMSKGSVEQVDVSKRVLLRTVDNFQGEEGTIVILSLVRNSGTAQTAHRGGIGFLKSNNRANVALSRARHGLYILGNAEDLSSRSGMWKKVVQELTERDCIGPSFSIACNRHQDTVRRIDRPGQLAFYAPDVANCRAAVSNVKGDAVTAKASIASEMARALRLSLGSSISGTPALRGYIVSTSATPPAPRNTTAPMYPAGNVVGRLAVITAVNITTALYLVALLVRGFLATSAVHKSYRAVINALLYAASRPGEMNTHAEELENMVITLSCKHVFTVETLDRICELEKYYTQDQHGHWADLSPPPEGLRQAPTCPLCCVPINSLRYGRVFKRANLDLSEQNFANSARRSIQNVIRRVKWFDIERAIRDFKTPLVNTTFQDARQKKDVRTPRFQRPFLDKASLLPVDVKLLGDQVGSYCPLSGEVVTAWNNVAQLLLSAYEQAVRVAESHPAHVQAYEAAVASLYCRYLGEFEHHPELLKEGIRPQDQALDQAKRHCGLLAPPRADIRFRVEAFWVTINIRFLMLRIAEDGMKSIDSYSEAFKVTRSAWMDFVGFLINSIEHDSMIAIQLSENSQSHRQVVKTTLLLMEAQYATAQHATARHIEGAPRRILESLKSRARNGSAFAKRTVAETSQAYLHTMSGCQEDQQWVDKHFIQPGNGIVDKWEGLNERLGRGVLHGTVLVEESEAILKASVASLTSMPEFSARGYFYQCPNGHVYVITECGGAMQGSRCPECGATIGGGSHTPEDSNIAATEFEAPTLEQGLPPNLSGFGI